MLEIGTNYILNDEPCFNLSELNLMSPMGWRRYRIYMVMRDDKLAKYQEDMGDAKDFKHDQIRIPGGVIDGEKIYIEHTVNELREIADQLKLTSFDKRELVGLDKINT